MSASALTGGAALAKPERVLDRWDFLAVAGVLLLFALAARAPVATQAFGDLDFDVEARQMAAALTGAGPWSAVDLVRAPGPVLYYLPPYLAVNGASDHAHWLAACSWNAGWCALALVLMRRAARSIGGPVAGGLALAAAFAWPMWAYYGCGVNGEVPAFAGVAAFCYGCARWLESEGAFFNRYALTATLGLCGLLLAKPAALLLIPLGALAAVVMWRQSAPVARRSARLAACLAAAALAVSLASSAVLKVMAARRAATAQEQYFYWTAFFGSFQFRHELWDWRFWGSKTRQGSRDYADFEDEYSRLRQRSAAGGIPLARLERDWVVNDFERHFFLHLRSAAVRAVSMNLPIANSVRPRSFRLGLLRGLWGYAVFHGVLFGISLLLVGGAVLFLAGGGGGILPRTVFYWWLWGPWVALLLFHSATYAEPRYLFPGQPGLMVMAAVAFATLVSGARQPAEFAKWQRIR